MDVKSKFITDFMSELSDIEPSTLRKVTHRLTLIFENYELSEKCTALQVSDNESLMMLKKFLATKRVEGKSEKTVERYRYIITRFYNQMQIAFDEVDVFTLRLYLAQLEQSGCNDNTVNGIRCVFSSFFSWLHCEGMISSNPTSNLKPIKCKKVIRKPYSGVELELIKNNCKTLRDRAVVEFLLSTGCRVAEICALNIDDVNFQTQECKVLGKGNKERIVYISDICALHLNKYINSRTDSEDALFIGKGSSRMTTGGIRAMLKRIEAVTGIDDIHPHRFRRTLATSLIDRGMTIQNVAEILGHVNINTTMSYVYIDSESIKHSYKKYAS